MAGYRWSANESTLGSAAIPPVAESLVEFLEAGFTLIAKPTVGSDFTQVSNFRGNLAALNRVETGFALDHFTIPVDHGRVFIGETEPDFERAKDALQVGDRSDFRSGWAWLRGGRRRRSRR
jgi:hypothetical protein